MKIRNIKTNKLIKASWNYKKDDQELLSRLTNNIKKHGQLENIVVRRVGESFEVVNGNHRLDAFLRLGYTTVACLDLGEVDTITAKEVAILLNETHFENDLKKLEGILGEINLESDISPFQEEVFDGDGGDKGGECPELPKISIIIQFCDSDKKEEVQNILDVAIANIMDIVDVRSIDIK
jgi:hypothetical protein